MNPNLILRTAIAAAFLVGMLWLIFHGGTP